MSFSEIILRLTLACVLGGIIGYERQARHKTAGIRTNLLVCLGSCLIMLLSLEIYARVEGKTNADPARLAAQVVSGIGFLGAGAIMKEGLTVIGLTTAACLWVVSGIGLAVGMGYYFGAICATLLIFLTVGGLSRLEAMNPHDATFALTVVAVESPRKLTEIYRVLEDIPLRVITTKVNSALDQNGRLLYLDFELENKNDVPLAAVLESILRLDGIVRANVM